MQYNIVCVYIRKNEMYLNASVRNSNTQMFTDQRTSKEDDEQIEIFYADFHLNIQKSHPNTH